MKGSGQGGESIRQHDERSHLLCSLFCLVSNLRLDLMLRISACSRPRHSRGALRLCCCITVFVAQAYAVNDTEEQFWPEADVFYSFNRSMRLTLLASLTKDQDVSYRDAEMGANLDIYVPRFQPVLFRRLVREDDSRMQRIQFRVGYRYNHSVNSRPSTTEERTFMDGTLRWAVPANILMSDRNRFEFRIVNGVYSWRYRNQVKGEKDFNAWHHPFTGYVSSEVFWDSRFNKWNRIRFTGGLVFPFKKKWELEPYYSRQITTTAQPRNTNGIGLRLNVYINKK
jgi:Protein of unknown function (DUF2490)